MQITLPTRPTQGPRRGWPSTALSWLRAVPGRRRRAVHGLELARVDPGQPAQAVGRECLARDVVDVALERADRPLPVQEPGLLLPLRAVAQQLHRRSPSREKRRAVLSMTGRRAQAAAGARLSGSFVQNAEAAGRLGSPRGKGL